MGESSSAENGGQVLLMAAAGQDYDGDNGGDGYSGGGATGAYGHDGGSDGSDGGHYGDSKGGKGSGLDVGTLNVTRFVLKPGKAGTHYSDYGGGGDGILVDGETSLFTEPMGE